MTPPKPRLFRAIAIIGVVLGSMGVLNATGGLMQLARNEQVPMESIGFEPKTEAEAQVARQIQAEIVDMGDRHRGVTVALHLANGALSLLLLAGAVTLATRRQWSRAIMVQAVGASILYEVPVAAHQIRLVHEGMGTVRSLLPEMARASNLTASPDQLAFFTAAVVVIWILGVAALRIAFYGVTFWYLRRRDVRAWFGDEPAS